VSTREPGSQRGPLEVAAEILIDAGAVLASSLDLATTMDHIARLTVPSLADLCVIDMRGEDGSIEKVAIAAREPEIAEQLERLRASDPPDPQGSHPVAEVMRSGESQLIAVMSDSQLVSFARGDEHARFMLDHRYRSAIVAPLRARGSTFGALSLLRLGDDAVPYTTSELHLAGELARRAALALDNAALYSDLRAVEQRLEAILAGLAEAITVEDRAGRTVFANQAAADLLGLADPGELVRAAPGTIATRFRLLDEFGLEVDLDELPGRRVLRGEQAAPLELRSIAARTGEERWLVVRSSPIVDPQSGKVIYAANVFENITPLKRAQLIEAFMAEAGRVLSSSLDPGETLQRVVQLVVPQLADGCLVDVVSARGELERVAMHHRDPYKLLLAERLQEHHRPEPADGAAVREVIRSGEAKLFGGITQQQLAGSAPQDGHLGTLAALQAREVIVAPLAAPARTFGAITLISSDGGRALTEADLDVAIRLGRRAGSAVERARLYTERTHITKVLESALLPETLPLLPGADLRALYRAAGELNDVGGDFYDVLAYGENAWMLVIGDVCGKGPRAAGVTALARHTLRAAALLGESPEGMLRTLHEALRRQPSGADLCTVCLALVELGDGDGSQTGAARLTLALAGHPPPVLVSALGKPRLVGVPGTLLGMVDPVEINQVALDLAACETLLLYTDGMTDGDRGGRALGEEGLLGLCEQAQERPLAALLEHVSAAAGGGDPSRLRDDIALLALRLHDPAAPPRHAARQGSRLRQRLPRRPARL
jgi:serine phosphatase RsbU (regulator of sigma subunit)/PAS domain-containing protein